jgi:hypothetical protein
MPRPVNSSAGRLDDVLRLRGEVREEFDELLGWWGHTIVADTVAVLALGEPTHGTAEIREWHIDTMLRVVS